MLVSEKKASFQEYLPVYFLYYQYAILVKPSSNMLSSFLAPTLSFLLNPQTDYQC